MLYYVSSAVFFFTGSEFGFRSVDAVCGGAPDLHYVCVVLMRNVAGLLICIMIR
jgi:hypothetical protein